MPIDYRIPLSARSPSLGEITNVRAQLAQERQRMKIEDDDNASREVLTQTQGNVQKAVEQLRKQGRNDVASRMETQLAQTRSSIASAMRQELDNERTVTEETAQLLQSVKDQQTLDLARQRIKAKRGDAAIADMPSLYNNDAATWVQQRLDESTSLQEKVRQKERAWQLLQSAPDRALKNQQQIAAVMATADTPEEWAALRQTLNAVYGVEPALMSFVPTEFSAELPAQMADAAMTANERQQAKDRLRDDERMDLARKQLDLDRRRNDDIRGGEALERQRHNRELERIASARAAASGGRTGTASSEVTARQAMGFKAREIRKIRTAMRKGEMTQEQYNEERLEIENLYREMIGQSEVASLEEIDLAADEALAEGKPPTEPPAAPAPAMGTQSVRPGAGTGGPTNRSGVQMVPGQQSVIPGRAPQPPLSATTGPGTNIPGTRPGSLANPSDAKIIAEAVRAILQKAGKDSSDASIQKFLASPQNRAALGIVDKQP